jgi:hypothetical protein
MSNGKFRNIRSFKDFEDEKLQLYYDLQLKEKKLQLTIYNLRANFSLEKVLYNLFLTNVVDPLFFNVKSMIFGMFGRLKQKITSTYKTDKIER